jgi:arsenite methyltransferase
MDTSSINIRYSELAQESCCLSCGGAINHAEAKEGEHCVDLGSGRGTDVLRMAELVGDRGFVYGVDVADGMLETSRSNAAKLGVTNVKFIQSDLEDIDIPSSWADLVISNCTLNHASNKQKVWDEIYRILKPGGRFIISDIYSSEPVSEAYRNDPKAVSECWGGAVTKNNYLEVIQVAGLGSVTILEESKPYPKGLIHVSSFTIFGIKQKSCCCCS